MWFRHRAWAPVAFAASLFNVGATWFAAMPGMPGMPGMGEPWHATMHSLLAALFAAGGMHLAYRNRVAEPVRTIDTEKLDRIERSVDAIALEIERVGEGQRFLTKALTEKERQPLR